MKPKSLILLTALLLIALLCAAPVAADAVTHNGKTYTTYDQIYASTTLSSSEKLALVQEMAGWTEELAAYMEWKNSGGLEAYQAAVSGGNSTSGDYGWDEAPGDGLGDGGTNIEPEYSYQERQAYDAAYEAYQAEFAAGYDYARATGASGSGTEADPYIVTTPAQLQEMANDLDAYYMLNADLDMSAYTGTTPLIGTSSSGFIGSLNGNGHKIININQPLFYCGANARFTDILFKSINIIYNTPVTIDTTGYLISNGVIYFTRVGVEDIYVTINPTVSGVDIGLHPFSNHAIIKDCYVLGGELSSKTYSGDYGTVFVTGGTGNDGSIDNFYTDLESLSATRVGGSAAILSALSYFYVSTDRGTMLISDTVVLSSVIGASTTTTSYNLYPHRILSNYYTSDNPSTGATLTNNYGYSPMNIGSITITTGSANNNNNGASVTAAEANTETWWKNNLDWDWGNVWYWDDDAKRPKLIILRDNIPPTISTISATPSIGGQQDTYTLSVSASTTAAGGIASYQWYGRIGSSGEWQAISDATSATYQFVPGAYALGDFYFKCVITGADGGVVDSYDAGYTNVKVTVVLAPQITSPAATPATGPLSQTVQLSASVTSTETVTSQWQELIGSTWTNISGATSATATVNIADSAATTHSYRLLATNVGGTSTSNTVTYQSVAAPTISSVSANPTTGPLTQSVTLSATVSGATSYQWQEQSGSTWQNIAGATSATYTANIADTAATTHSYRLLATNVGGTTTSATVAYTSIAPPSITAVTVSPTIGQYTETITLSAEVSDSGPDATTYQWQQSPEGQNTWTNIQGATTAQWIGQLTFSGATDFRLIATGTGGTTTSATTTYYIALPGEIQSLSATPSVVALPGSTTLSATGANVITWEWQELISGTWTTIGYGASLQESLTTEGTYTYRVLATGADGTTITSETVEVLAGYAPTVSITSPADNVQFPTQSQITVSADITGTDVVYEWDFGSLQTINGGNTNPTWVTYLVDGQYTITLRAESIFGSTSDSVTIISGVMPRPMATEKFDAISTAPVTAFVESFNVPQGEILDLPAVFGALTAPMSDLLPDGMFMVIVFGVIFIMLWIMTKNTAVPSIIGLIFGGFILALLPASYNGAAVVILAISIVGGVIRVFIPPK